MTFVSDFDIPITVSLQCTQLGLGLASLNRKILGKKDFGLITIYLRMQSRNVKGDPHLEGELWSL